MSRVEYGAWSFLFFLYALCHMLCAVNEERALV